LCKVLFYFKRDISWLKYLATDWRRSSGWHGPNDGSYDPNSSR
jgi:hypothetical protein